MSQKGTPKKAAFLAAYSVACTIRGAAKYAGVARRTHYKWLASDSEYAKEFSEAKMLAIYRLEDIARERAVNGVCRLKFDRYGKPLIDPETGEPYQERVYSDTLLIFLMKALAPERFCENAKHRHVGRIEHAAVQAR